MGIISAQMIMYGFNYETGSGRYRTTHYQEETLFSGTIAFDNYDKSNATFTLNGNMVVKENGEFQKKQVEMVFKQ